MKINRPQGFQGKSPFIQEMKAALAGECKALTLSGLGDTDKSQLMLRQCYLNEATYMTYILADSRQPEHGSSLVPQTG